MQMAYIKTIWRVFYMQCIFDMMTCNDMRCAYTYFSNGSFSQAKKHEKIKCYFNINRIIITNDNNNIIYCILCHIIDNANGSMMSMSMTMAAITSSALQQLNSHHQLITECTKQNMHFNILISTSQPNVLLLTTKKKNHIFIQCTQASWLCCPVAMSPSRGGVQVSHSPQHTNQVSVPQTHCIY